MSPDEARWVFEDVCERAARLHRDGLLPLVMDLPADEYDACRQEMALRCVYEVHPADPDRTVIRMILHVCGYPLTLRLAPKPVQ